MYCILYKLKCTICLHILINIHNPSNREIKLRQLAVSPFRFSLRISPRDKGSEFLPTWVQGSTFTAVFLNVASPSCPRCFQNGLAIGLLENVDRCCNML